MNPQSEHSCSHLNAHLNALRDCRLCPQMRPPPVVTHATLSRVMLVGQAPGPKEPVLQRPFAWTAGKTLFGWFRDAYGVDEARLRERIFIAAVCRCFPGKTKAGGDRVPKRSEIDNCSRWLRAEFMLLRPTLVIPVGRLAIEQFIPYRSLADHVGRCYSCLYADQRFDLIPLPHPSGASPWPRVEPGKTLLRQALTLLESHPALRAALL